MISKQQIISNSLELLPIISEHDLEEGDYIVMPFRYGDLIGTVLFTIEYTGDGLSWILTTYECNLIVRIPK